MECNITNLNSGFNGTGISIMVSMERMTSSSNSQKVIHGLSQKSFGSSIPYCVDQGQGDRVVLNRFLVNAGDSTQRFCSENRIKLSNISCIIITSLCPHNISGFPGIFLSLSDLGAGELIVVGPSGLKSYIDIMTPFINRKYPALKIIEIDSSHSSENFHLNINYFTLNFHPITMPSSNQVVAIAVKITAISSNLTESAMAAVIPIADYFSVEPTLSQLAQWVDSPNSRKNILKESITSVSSGSTNQEIPQSNITLYFLPLAASSLCTSLNQTPSDTSKDSSNDNDVLDMISKVCRSIGAMGVFIKGTVSNSETEFRHAQSTLAIMRMLYTPLFPLPLTSNNFCLTSQKLGSNSKNRWVNYLNRDNNVSFSVDNHANQSIDRNSYMSNCSYSPFIPGAIINCFPLLTLSFKVNKSFSLAMSPISVLTSPTSDSLDMINDNCISEKEKEENILIITPTHLLDQSALKYAVKCFILETKVLPEFKTSRSRIEVYNSATKVEEVISDEQQTSKPLAYRAIAENFVSDLIAYNKNKILNDKSSVSSVVAVTSTVRLVAEHYVKNLLNIDSSTFSSVVDNERIKAFSLGGDYPMEVRTGKLNNNNNNNNDREDTFIPFKSRKIGSNSDISNSFPILESSTIVGLSIITSPIDLDNASLTDPIGSGPNSFADNFTEVSTPNSNFVANNLIQKSNSDKQLLVTSFHKRKHSFHENTQDIDSMLSPRFENISIDNLSYNSFGFFDDNQPITNSFLNNPIQSIESFISLNDYNSNNHIPPPNPASDKLTITFLGTGSATPSKYRNSSSILLTLNSNSNDKKYILLDIGEGTSSQLFQSVGGDIDKFDEVLLNIKIIWVSHHHADHTSGFPMLLENVQRAKIRNECKLNKSVHYKNETRNKHSITHNACMTVKVEYEKDKILVIATESVLRYFEFSACISGLDDLITLFNISKTLYAGNTRDVMAATDNIINRLQSIPVYHCNHSYGLVLDAIDFKLVYSGDCRPSQSLVKCGLNCDILIHEATFDDSKAEDAVKKKHSTISEAKSISKQMKAKHTILTHFSQRYPISINANDNNNNNNNNNDAAKKIDSNCIDIDDINCTDNSDNDNSKIIFAYDFLHFSYPSQILHIPNAINDLSSIMTLLENEMRK